MFSSEPPNHRLTRPDLAFKSAYILVLSTPKLLLMDSFKKSVLLANEPVEALFEELLDDELDVDDEPLTAWVKLSNQRLILFITDSDGFAGSRPYFLVKTKLPTGDI